MDEQPEYICAKCGKGFEPGEQLFLDERPYDDIRGWFHKDCQPKPQPLSVLQRTQIREQLTFLCQNAYDAGFTVGNEVRTVTGKDVERQIDEVLSAIGLILGDTE